MRITITGPAVAQDAAGHEITDAGFLSRIDGWRIVSELEAQA